MTVPHITLLFAACGALLQVALTALVIARRAETNIPFLHAGDDALLRRIRAHGNCAETVPIAIVLIGLLELAGFGATWLWALGGTLIAARVVHAYALLRPGGVLWARITGMVATLAVISVLAGACLWMFVF